MAGGKFNPGTVKKERESSGEVEKEKESIKEIEIVEVVTVVDAGGVEEQKGTCNKDLEVAEWREPIIASYGDLIIEDKLHYYSTTVEAKVLYEQWSTVRNRESRAEQSDDEQIRAVFYSGDQSIAELCNAVQCDAEQREAI